MCLLNADEIRLDYNACHFCLTVSTTIRLHTCAQQREDMQILLLGGRLTVPVHPCVGTALLSYSSTVKSLQPPGVVYSNYRVFVKKQKKNTLLTGGLDVRFK